MPKAGPLTREELKAIWASALDKGYRDPFLKAGDGGGLEAHSQMWAVLERVSQAVDRTTQAMYLCPWSGQTNPPAAGAARATVTLGIARSKRLETPLRLAAGTFVVGERITIATELGGVEVDTGRYYELVEDLVFHPGEPGPLTVPAIAQRPGYGYNNPLPDSIRSIQQSGALFENDFATLAASYPAYDSPLSASVVLATALQADTPVPEHAGQYFLIVGTTNTPPRQARVAQFISPPDATIGSSVFLESEASVILTGVVGTFTAGEAFSFGVTAQGTVLKHSTVGANSILTYVRTQGAVSMGDVATGAMSGATGTVSSILYEDAFQTEAPVGSVGGVSWRAMEWVTDFGMVVTHPLSPEGGRAAFLDEKGYERNIQRAPGEADDTYLVRLKKPSDVVSPNAIRRALNKVLGSLPWCFREVGTTDLRGWFYDGDLSPVGGNTNTNTTVADLNDAYDTDTILLTIGVPDPLAFDEGEPIVLETDIAGIHYASGYYSRYIGATLVFIRTNGYAPSTFAGLQVRAPRTGSTAAVIGGSVPSSSSDRRWRTSFDYAEFRGFFIVCAPKVSIGEFGFYYDAPGAMNAYDAPLVAGNFYDGYPAGNSAFYQRIYQAVDTVRAGGVGWEMEACGDSCP